LFDCRSFLYDLKQWTVEILNEEKRQPDQRKDSHAQKLKDQTRAMRGWILHERVLPFDLPFWKCKQQP
jgi:hypothetical protein